MLSEKFQILSHCEVFDLLYDMSKDMTPRVLSNKCTKLCNGLTHCESKGISAVDLNDKLKKIFQEL